MKPAFPASLLAVCLVSALTGPARAEVQVKFIEPKSFSDIRDNDGFSRLEVLSELEAHIVAQANKRLPGLDLRISVTDVNLAGEVEPLGRRAQWIRTLRTVTIPSLSLRYEVLEGGKVVRSGEALLRDTGYLDGFNPYSSSDPLRYERRMIDRWMDRELAPSMAVKAPR